MVRLGRFGLAVLVATVACGGEAEKTSSGSSAPAGTSTGAPAKSTATASATAAAAAGTPYTSDKGGFSNTFPVGKPEESTKDDAKKVVWNDVSSTVGAYSVQYADFPSPKEAQASVDDYITGMKSEVKENKEVTIGDHKARELKMKISETATMWLRIVAVDKRAYKISAGTKNDQEKAYKFLDSFKLTK
jgi:hypothetical protein